MDKIREERIDIGSNTVSLKMNVFLPLEKTVVEYLRGKTGSLFIDVGAFVGEYSVNLSENFGEVWAIEPALDSVRKLNLNIGKFDCENIKVFPFAIDKQVGRARLFRNADHIERAKENPIYGGMTGLIRSGLRGTGIFLYEVETKPLSDLIGGRRVSLIKVDTEGREKEVFESAVPVMSQIDSWFFELHRDSRSNFLREVSKYGYTEERNFDGKRFIVSRGN